MHGTGVKITLTLCYSLSVRDVLLHRTEQLAILWFCGSSTLYYWIANWETKILQSRNVQLYFAFWMDKGGEFFVVISEFQLLTKASPLSS